MPTFLAKKPVAIIKNIAKSGVKFIAVSFKFGIYKELIICPKRLNYNKLFWILPSNLNPSINLFVKFISFIYLFFIFYIVFKIADIINFSCRYAFAAI